MGKNHNTDPIEDLREWEEHMYNSGYWVNRFTPFFPPKRSIHMWILALIDLFLVVPGAILIWFYVLDENEFSIDFIIVLSILTLFGIMAILRAIRLRPENEGPPQELREKWNRKSRRERKKQPKRRKDYK
jgi:hypothetical protein